MSEPTAQEVNGALFDMFDRGLDKEAQQAVTDFTRIRMREEGFFRDIITPVTVTDADLDGQVDTDNPVVICEKEPASPPAYSVPFGTAPFSRYIRSNKYRVMFQRLMTAKFYKDIAQLRTYKMDIRQIISDNALKDMQSEEDGKFIATVEAILGGAAGVVNPDTGVSQWEEFSSGIDSKDTWADARKILRKTDNGLTSKTALMNHVTVLDLEKWTRDEMGGDMTEQISINGFGETTFGSQRVLVTIKNNIVPTDRVYFFADEKALGKFFVLDDTTMYVKAEAFMIEFYAYACQGAAIANSAGLGIADFNAAA